MNQAITRRKSLPCFFKISVILSLPLIFPSPVRAAATTPQDHYETQILDLCEIAKNPRSIQSSNAEFSPLDAKGFQIAFTSDGNPKVEISSPADIPWNWSEFTSFLVEISNPSKDTVTLGIRITDSKSDSKKKFLDGRIMLAPSSTETIQFPFVQAPKSQALHTLAVKPPGSFRPMLIKGDSTPSLRSITSLTFYLPRSIHPISANQTNHSAPLQFSNLRLAKTPNVSMDGIVDSFGQYTRTQWSGKISDIKDFISQRKMEEADLAANPSMPDRNIYGGWSKGPKFEATGFFRVQKIKGANGDERWWFIDPDGYLFLASGMFSAGPNRTTFVTSREKMFTWLPAEGDPLAKYMTHRKSGVSAIKEGQAYDFYCANLERKYGPNWEPFWKETTLKRLRSWGFNVLTTFDADWFFQNADGHLRNWKFPYALVTGPGTISGRGNARVKLASDPSLSTHDPFDPLFRENLAASLGPIAEANKNNPYLIGYFINNEIRWGLGVDDPKLHFDLVYGTLKSNASEQPAKRELVSRLKKKYETIETLNAAWGTSLASWQALEPSLDLTKSTITPGLLSDLSDFLRHYTDTYFRISREEIKKVDPNHLYLGCRDAFWIQEELESASKYCDVLTLNIYRPILPKKLGETLASLGKPCMVTEFHFGALDSGLFNPSLVWASSQQTRAEQYSHYIQSILQHPSFIGWSWYEYVDQPLLGRIWDGENLNDGFINVADAPYPFMVEAARKAHKDMYSVRFGATR